MLQGLAHGQKGSGREDCHLVAELDISLLAQHRSLATLHDIHQQWHVSQPPPDLRHFLLRLGRLHEQDVRARVREGAAPADRLLQAQICSRIRPRDYQKIRRRSRRDGNFNLGDRLLDRNHFPARRVPALFGELLVFKLYGTRACRLVALDRVLHVEQATEPSIRVTDQRAVRQAGHYAHALDHVPVARQARIWHAQVRANGAKACHVQGLEAGLICDEGGDAIEDARADE
mmetsp:Transcript_144532/g.463133  ORF Transcript_144532/g.463133 Transcript_144532/m.463133 type:complete len:231 (-) Transcript_144532:87-779(-)